MLLLRRAMADDVPFLVSTDLLVDLQDETDDTSRSAPAYAEGWGEHERAEHRAKIAAYVDDADKGAWVYEDTERMRNVGLIMCWFRDRRREPRTAATDFLFRFIDESVLPPDGCFCEVFQLWVDPAYRRRGLASALKRQVEDESRQRGIGMIYTHTRERNAHVVELNRKLGYVEVRRGPMWDDVARVSLVKWLMM
ncbi:MAG: GNAT family N-acetyltransferase [Chloroflexi bacterium]|nr:GNAT family N-acetyltransferase [Chloroflexota bacterium]